MDINPKPVGLSITQGDLVFDTAICFYESVEDRVSLYGNGLHFQHGGF